MNSSRTITYFGTTALILIDVIARRDETVFATKFSHQGQILLLMIIIIKAGRDWCFESFTVALTLIKTWRGHSHRRGKVPVASSSGVSRLLLRQQHRLLTPATVLVVVVLSNAIRY